jgi:5-methylcytosine-specific restriction endonuclease McrA
MVPVRVATAEGSEIMMLTQFLASEEFAGIFDEVRDLMSGAGVMSYGDIALAVFREYRDRHSPLARQKRREAKKGEVSPDSHRWESAGRQVTKKGSASLHSHQWECDDQTKPTRYIPDEVRDAVWARDGGQCTFVAPDGTQCRCRKGLEVDHIHPFANHGGSEFSNLKLLCGGHNRFAAERAMGKHVMQPYWRQP